MEMEVDYELAELMFKNASMVTYEGYHELAKLYADELFLNENLDQAIKYQEKYVRRLYKETNLDNDEERYHYLKACLEYGEYLINANRHNGFFEENAIAINELKKYDDVSLLRFTRLVAIRRYRSNPNLIEELEKIKEPLFRFINKHIELKPYIGLYYFELYKLYIK